VRALGIRERIAKWLLRPVLTKATQDTQSLLPFVSVSESGRPVFADWTTERAIQHGLKASVWVYAAIRKIAPAASAIPWHVEERKSEGVWERIEGHPIEILLDYPNEFMSGQDLRERAVYHLWLGGNSVWHMPLVKNTPMELWPVAPDKIKPVPDRVSYIKHYEFSDSGKKIPIPSQQIIHMQFVNPSNPYWGISPLQAAAMVIDTDVEAVRWNKVSLQRRAAKDGVIYPAQPLTKPQWEEARAQLQAQVYGTDNARGILLMSSPGRFEPMSMSAVELDFIKSRLSNREEIAAAMGIPLVLLTGQGTYRNFETARRALWEDVIIPLLDDMAEALNTALVPYWDPEARKPGVAPRLRIVYDLSNVTALQEDFGQKVVNAEKLVNMGWTLNQVNQRLELGFDNVPWGDEPRSSRSAIVASDASEPKSLKATNWTEEQKVAYWKATESTRESWEQKLGQAIAEQFEREAEEVVAAYETDEEDAALAAVDDQMPEWESLLSAALTAIVEFAGQEEIDRLAAIAEKSSTGPSEVKLEFDPWADIIRRWVRATAAKHVQKITETTKEWIRGEIRLGIDAGESSKEIAKRIKDRYESWANPADSDITMTRAMTIARTESHAAVHYGHRQGARQASDEWGLELTKEWIAARDGRVRDSHDAIDGETHKMDESYSNGLMYPGDPSGPPEEVINCRCTERHRVIL